MTASTYDTRACALGEGPLWHPERGQLFWFDIIGHRLLTVENGEQMEWQFDEFVSAAGWIDHGTLLIASETALSKFDIDTGETEFVCALEADNDATRSNDGRADPQGGFWIGTMGKNAEPKAGAIYRYFDGALTKLFGDISISNAICFAPDGRTAYFADTATQTIMRVALDADGWPEGDPHPFIKDAENPDGAVVDAQGNLWNAKWEGWGVTQYSPDGTKLRHLSVDASQTTCPAFGGPDGTTLFVTSAADGLDKDAAAHGQTFAIETDVKGQQEHRVIL
ncbi:SMP-30/gluconolactonase/LRE family protein [Celeribacter sp.]|uniref:SMP-30/gluconolactonase/LRE family protein n=1 Tax=Celeribacter sp. TaxID=1890673 RepID=UPI003A8FF077